MRKKHGQRHTPLYSKWQNMIKRCTNPNNIGYKNYGGRGISICPEWRNSFISFAEWANSNGYNDKLTLDRINNDGDYTPQNCKWSTMQEQAINRRKQSNNTSGSIGVNWCAHANKWIARIQYKGKRINIGSFKNKQDAIKARNDYIVSNNLPHKLNVD